MYVFSAYFCYICRKITKDMDESKMVLRTEDLVKKYGKRTVVSHVSINVKQGDTFTVYAQSTGEDTMGRLTACLPQDSNSYGNVEYYVWPENGMSGIGSSTRWRKHNSGIDENAGTIIINGVHFSAESKDTLEDKMKRLMRDDVKADNF